MSAPAAGHRARVLAHLADHPGLTATELGRALGIGGQADNLLRRMEARAEVVAVRSPVPHTARRWEVAVPGSVPPPRLADPEAVRRRRERDRRSQAARRGRVRGPAVRIVLPSLPAAACSTADPDLFFGPDHYEDPRARGRRERQAKDYCAGCPARAACLAYALGTRQAFGIWGGTDEAERRTMLRQARRAS